MGHSYHQLVPVHHLVMEMVTVEFSTSPVHMGHSYHQPVPVHHLVMDMDTVK